MEENEVVWPSGMTDRDPSSIPLIFNPKGFVVAILDDADHAEPAKTSLTNAGFTDGHLRVYTCQQILG